MHAGRISSGHALHIGISQRLPRGASSPGFALWAAEMFSPATHEVSNNQQVCLKFIGATILFTLDPSNVERLTKTQLEHTVAIIENANGFNLSANISARTNLIKSGLCLESTLGYRYEFTINQLNRWVAIQLSQLTNWDNGGRLHVTEPL